MRDFAATIGMLLAAVVGITVMFGVATGDWHTGYRLGGYGALAIGCAGVVYGGGYAALRAVWGLIRRGLDRRANR